MQKVVGDSLLPDIENAISHMLTHGLLARSTNRTLGYHFASPSVGFVATNVVRGRMELLGAIARKKTRCILDKDMISGKLVLKKSILSLKFHLRDLEGSGKLHVDHKSVQKKYCLA